MTPVALKALRSALRHRNSVRVSSVSRIVCDYALRDETMLTTQKRRRSSSLASSSTAEDGKEPSYVGGFSSTVSRVKMLSLGSLGATCIGCPILIEMSQSGLEASTKLVLAGSMSSIGAFTTFLLQWFVRPYVHRLWIDGDVVTAEKTSLMLRKYKRNFKISEMKISGSAHPLVTWEDTAGEKFYLEPAQTTEEVYELLQLKRFEPDTSKDTPDDDDDEEDENR